jgi:glutamate 5-kinase
VVLAQEVIHRRDAEDLTEKMSSTDNLFSAARRIVIKVGSALLTDLDNKVRREWLATLADDIAELHAAGKQIVIVSSGAIALGRQTLNYGTRKLELAEKQAAAACGQIMLCAEWARVFQLRDCRQDSGPSKNVGSDKLKLFGHFQPLATAQILLTLDDSENRDRYLNARNTFAILLSQSNIVPIVNENDTVATEEIRVGDNDRLAARVAQMISADLLILLSDVDGLYTKDPRIAPHEAVLVSEVDEITPEILEMAGGVGSASASGGMYTKIDAAKIAVGAGCHMLIGRGTEPHPILSLLNGGARTWFKAKANPQSARKHWISGTLRSRGSFIVDDGAKSALLAGKSLLPAGIAEVKGDFDRGDAVAIETLGGRRIGKGLSEYSSSDSRKIIGMKSSEIETVLGYKNRDTLIHRDDMVLENGAK